ncbi:hypothetical protein MesoLj131b_69750 (plasmid) [Mesorhizobium sp. 131-2-5]|nr:hypothetical protein MesoLj131b_69750 [Mesorhizobium sp. 131-2-5]
MWAKTGEAAGRSHGADARCLPASPEVRRSLKEEEDGLGRFRCIAETQAQAPHGAVGIR